MPKLGENLKFIRKVNGWSQQELADLLGIKRNNISAYELRGIHPRYKVLNDLSKLTRLSVDDLLGSSLREKENLKPFASTNISFEEVIRLKDEIIEAKNAEIEALKQTVVALTEKSTEVTWTSTNSEGKFVQWSSIEIASEAYVELGPGILDRAILSPSDLIFDWERKFIPILEKLDYNNQRVILNRSAKGSLFSKHYHAEAEYLYCIEGSFRESVTNTVLRAGDVIYFKPFEPHETEFLEDSLLIVVLDKT